MKKNRARSFCRVGICGGMIILNTLLVGCTGLSIEKPTSPPGIKGNFLIETPEAKYPLNTKVALLVTSYDFIKQQTQPFFITEQHVPDYIFLDYHHGKANVGFDKALRERLMLYLTKKLSLNVFDLKSDKQFCSFASSPSLQLSNIIEWLRSNTDMELFMAFHYSLGEKGQVRGIPILSITGNQYMQFYSVKTAATWIETFSGFTFQASVFDIITEKRIIAYNLPIFVKPHAAIYSLDIDWPKPKKELQTLCEVLSTAFESTK
jgi:hypothetical protein